MGSGKAKKQEQQNDRYVRTAINDVKTINPLEQRLNSRSMKFFDWQDGTGEYAGKPRSILDAPGISDTLDLYGGAEQLANTERFGDGAVRLADPAAGSAYGTQMKQQKDMQLYDNRAAGVSNALGVLKAENTGQVGDLMNRDFARKNAVLGAESENRRDYYARPVKKPLWETIAGLAIGGATAASGFRK
jgi:hypothetical protein